MKQKHKVYLELLNSMRNENQSMSEQHGIDDVMAGYFNGKIAAFDRCISIFSSTFNTEMQEESK